MKTFILKLRNKCFFTAFIIVMLCGVVTTHAQTAQDEQDVRNRIDLMVADWNTHNFQNMESYTTADVEWVNIVGMYWRGLPQVKMSHQSIFDAIFKNVPFTKKEVSVRFITPDVAVTTLLCHVGAFFPPDGVDRGNNKRPETDDLLTMVFVKKNNKWLLTAGQNTVVDEYAQRVNPAKKQ